MRMSDWSSDVFSSDLDADLKDRRMIGTIGKAAGVNGVAIAAPDARGERGAPARPPHHAGVSDQPVGVEGQLARLRFVGDETAIRIDDRRAVRVEHGVALADLDILIDRKSTRLNSSH